MLRRDFTRALRENVAIRNMIIHTHARTSLNCITLINSLYPILKDIGLLHANDAYV